MNIKEMSLDELELLSYADIAYEIIKLEKKTMNTPTLFGEVCKLLEINEDQMYEMIGDFYTNLTTDKRFILLDDAVWDLKEFHVVKTIIDEDDNDSEIEEEQEIDPEENETEDNAVLGDEDNYDEDIDELDDLSIVTEEELEE